MTDTEYKEKRERARKANKKYYSKSSYAAKHKKRWTTEEDEILIQGGESEEVLANILGRSIASIQKRRCVLKKSEV